MSAQDLLQRQVLAQRSCVQSESSSSSQHAEVLQRLGNIEAALALLRFPMPSPMLKVSEAAKVLRVSEATVKRWIESGKLKASRFDLGSTSVFRVAQADLQAFINWHLVGPTEPMCDPHDDSFLEVPDIDL